MSENINSYFDFDDDIFGETSKYVPDITKPNFTEMLKNDREKGIKEIIKYSKYIKNIEEQQMISFYYNPVLLFHCTIDEKFKFMKFEVDQHYNAYNERHLMSKEDKK